MIMRVLIKALDFHSLLFENNLVFSDFSKCIVQNIGQDIEIMSECQEAVLLSAKKSKSRSAGHGHLLLPSPRGPGTELKVLLAKIGITSSPDCKCNHRAIYMDAQGCDWCEANLDEIVGWLRESAAERGLPFVDLAGRLLVRRAIANARRKEAERARGSQRHD